MTTPFGVMQQPVHIVHIAGPILGDFGQWFDRDALAGHSHTLRKPAWVRQPRGPSQYLPWSVRGFVHVKRSFKYQTHHQAFERYSHNIHYRGLCRVLSTEGGTCLSS